MCPLHILIYLIEKDGWGNGSTLKIESHLLLCLSFPKPTPQKGHRIVHQVCLDKKNKIKVDNLLFKGVIP